MRPRGGLCPVNAPDDAPQFLRLRAPIDHYRHSPQKPLARMLRFLRGPRSGLVCDGASELDDGELRRFGLSRQLEPRICPPGSDAAASASARAR